MAIGLSLKFGLLFAGEFDGFPHLVGSSDCDTLGGQVFMEWGGARYWTGTHVKICAASSYGPESLAIGAVRNTAGREEFKLKEYESEVL